MKKELLHIVLADDDADDRMLFADAVDEIDITTSLKVFKHGQELMDYLMDESVLLPDIVFLDLNMPIKNGMQCLKEIRQTPHLAALCVAIYSTSSSEQDIEETFVKGANIYINKPTSFTKLKRTVEKVLRLNWQYHTANLNKHNFLLRL
ncbi:response regulator [Allomuricauda sp. d1]|uniref:response regulator n=1 Tax=Allomuricauda sp. d1 TaxID=3136725 RepID=UPI0031D9CCAF